MFNKTSTLPATFRNKEEDANKSGTLPRDGVSLDRNTSFSKRFRKSVSKLIGVNEKDEKSPHENSPQKETSPEVPNSNGEISPSKSKDENDSTVKSPVDHKLAQKLQEQNFSKSYTQLLPMFLNHLGVIMCPLTLKMGRIMLTSQELLL